MRILCTGDIHIGRLPSRLPADAPRRAVAISERWLAIVEFAVRSGVDVVALSGDLVDRANRFFEAFGPLEAGIRRLHEAGITTVAIAGNHDFDVLPQLAQDIDSDRFHFLGHDARWERVRIEKRSEALEVHGWSFPTEHVRTQPHLSYDLDRVDDVPILGLLHCDLNGSGSAYAPVADAALRSLPPGLWLLGHLHQPRLHSSRGGADLLYPGSPQPLDPGERGAHGVWLVETAETGFHDPEFIPMATVRYESLDVDVNGLADLDKVKSRIVDRIADLRDSLQAGAGARPAYLSLRGRLSGRTALGRRALEEAVAGQIGDLELSGETRCVVEKLEIETLPELDLEELARAGDAPGALARLLISLRDAPDEEDPAALLTSTRDIIDRVATASAYLPLRSSATGAPPVPSASELLRAQAYLLLEELVGQKDSP